MPAALPPGLTVAGRSHLLARALAVTVLAVPLVIATMALTPALIICPFLTAAHRHQVTVLLASLQQWTASLARPGPGHRCSCSEPRPASPVMQRSGRGGCPCRAGTARKG
jgi:hypothetical protein